MPQMKPMNWFILFLMLNITLLMLNIMNYFNFKYNLTKNTMKKNKNFNNWKW